MSSCLSLNSRPISFSALCIMSFVMRPGVGDGRGEGIGVGVGVWAIAFKGRFATVNPAAPAAGRSLTKARRLMPRFFCAGPGFFITILKVDSMIRSLSLAVLKRRPVLLTAHCPLSLRRRAVLHLHNFRFAGSIDGYDVQVVVFAFRNCWVSRTTKRRDDFRHRVVVSGDQNCL